MSAHSSDDRRLIDEQSDTPKSFSSQKPVSDSEFCEEKAPKPSWEPRATYPEVFWARGHPPGRRSPGKENSLPVKN
jgi:hypothetical protein